MTDPETENPARQTQTEPILFSTRSAASEIRALTPSSIIDGPVQKAGRAASGTQRAPFLEQKKAEIRRPALNGMLA
ncbi:hypothetical protein [Burkholderia pseudomultivorans]|uniref:hypothetical protein n=1 Tax=Burkholderia pseudomultivorans TaxID=1207504 RepID=UPI0018C78C47|nr:hypothetical protein [Burkholderia pseudomultivorans]